MEIELKSLYGLSNFKSENDVALLLSSNKIPFLHKSIFCPLIPGEINQNITNK